MITRCRRVAMTAGAAALMVNSACYAYQPSNLPITATEQRLRLHLTPNGITEMARYLGPRIAVADGMLASQGSDGSLTLSVESVQTSDGTRQPWSGEGVVTFPSMYVSSVEEQVLNQRQSIFAGLAISAAVIAIAITALRSTGAGGTIIGGGGTPP